MGVNRIVLIAGPSGIGKSYFIDRLSQGDLEEFAEDLNIEEPAAWQHVFAKELRENPAQVAERIFFHYDLTGPWKHNIQNGFWGDRSLQVLDSAGATTVVTLFASPEVILRRYFKRQKETKGLFRFLFRLARPAQEIKLYREPAKLLTLYHEWYEFCQSRYLKDHWQVNTTDNPMGYERLTGDVLQATIGKIFAGH